MGNKLYVGNLPYGVRDNDLEQAFSQFGAVASARVMMERDTGRSKGFGFVEMASEAEAQAAIQGMNGQPLGGRSLIVNEARPMEPRPLAPAVMEVASAVKAVLAAVIAMAVTVAAVKVVAMVVAIAAAAMAVVVAAKAASAVPMAQAHATVVAVATVVAIITANELLLAARQ